MHYIFLAILGIQIISCGSEIKTEEINLGGFKVQNFCTISASNEAWQQGRYVAKSMCEQRTLGDVRKLCSATAQRNCIEGIISYVKNSPCSGSAKFHNPDIHRIMCPL